MDNFKTLMEKIAVMLKAYNYTKKGSAFYLDKSGNQGLIEFQKSKSKPADGISFTINLGVFSTELWNRGGDPIKGRPDASMCHWSKRIGFLLPQKKDHWWLLPDNAPADATIAEIEQIVSSIAVPAIESHISDADLAEAWLSGEGGGLTEYTRLSHLTTLLKLMDHPRLPEAVAQFKSLAKSKAMENTINGFLKDLKIENI